MPFRVPEGERREQAVAETPDFESLLERVRCASLVDAMGSMYAHRCHALDLVSPTSGKKLFGPVVTIAYLPFRADVYQERVHNFAALFYEAIEDAPPGAVLVLASGGHPEASLGGGTKLSRADNHGLTGVLADGRLRDFEELSRYRFVTYCRGETPRAGGGTVMPYAANVPVIIDRVTVFPGDYAYADGSGAVIIPAAALQRVLEEAAKVEADDARFLENIRHEDPEAVRRYGGQEV